MSWQKILAQGFSTPEALLDYLGLPQELTSTSAHKQFKTKVPLGFAARMQPGNRFDPLLLQVLATDEETYELAGYTADPLAESTVNTMQGLLHKYQGRVLLTLAGVCAINCRYCFRRHFPYQANNPGRQGWQQVIDYIRKEESIQEVILSGGDPLLASDVVLGEFLETLAAISHVNTVRFHTRIPIVLPERINQTLLFQLQQSRLNKVIVVHCNHAQEINETVKQACVELKQAGCHLLNQSVLLKGINDNAQTLADLSKVLFDCQILPYYLHLLDKVAGAAHFDLPLDRALSIFRELQILLPGYLVPRLAREEASKRHKTLFV